MKSCLDTVHVTAADLQSGEPDLVLVGHRAYGRRNTFLLQSGIQQIEILFSGWDLKHREG